MFRFSFSVLHFLFSLGVSSNLYFYFIIDLNFVTLNIKVARDFMSLTFRPGGRNLDSLAKEIFFWD
jgi:hypothetical protein